MNWECPYCKKVAKNGENKLRHLAKHEPAIRKLLRDNFRKTLVIMNLATNPSLREGR